MANRQFINLLLKDQLLNTILPRLFHKYNNECQKHRAYMVVIGGISVEMCAKLDETSLKFLKNVFSEDVDIKLVVNQNGNIDKLHKVRMRFIKRVVRELNAFIDSHKYDWDASISMKIQIDTSLLQHNIDTVRASKIVGIVVDYTETRFRTSFSLLDTSLFTNHVPHYSVYRDTMKVKELVPYYTSKNVNYASCEYMMYDNCRMLIDRANYLKTKKTLFALMKFIKYVIKFMALYVLRKKIKSLPPQLNKIYEDAYVILTNINTFKIKNGFNKLHDVKYNQQYIDQVVSNLDVLLKASSLSKLIKSLKSI